MSRQVVDKDDVVSVIEEMEGISLYSKRNARPGSSRNSRRGSIDSDDMPEWYRNTIERREKNRGSDITHTINDTASVLDRLVFDLFGTTREPGILRRMMSDISYIKAKIEEMEDVQEILAIKPPRKKKHYKKKHSKRPVYESDDETSHSDSQSSSTDDYQSKRKGKGKSVKAKGENSRKFSASIGYERRKKASGSARGYKNK